MRPRVSESGHAPEPSVGKMWCGDTPVRVQCSVIQPIMEQCSMGTVRIVQCSVIQLGTAHCGDSAVGTVSVGTVYTDYGHSSVWDIPVWVQRIQPGTMLRKAWVT